MSKDDCRCTNSYYRNKPQIKLETETTHNSFFKPIPLEKPVRYDAPKVIQKHYDPSLLQSNYASNFTKPPPSNNYNSNDTALISQYYQNKPKNIPFSTETQYNKSYQKSNIPVQKQPTYQYKPKNTKFQGQSSYKSQFVPKTNSDLKNSGQEAALIQQYNSRKAKVPFVGTSAYKETFKDFGVKPERQPQYKYEPKKTKFQGQSSYKSTFKEMPREVYKSDTEYCPVHPDRVAIK